MMLMNMMNHIQYIAYFFLIYPIIHIERTIYKLKPFMPLSNLAREHIPISVKFVVRNSSQNERFCYKL